MTLEEFRKKYGTESVQLIIASLASRCQLSPHMVAVIDELRADLNALLK